MGRKQLAKSAALFVQIVLCIFLSMGMASAQMSSSNYKVEETVFGIGGELDASSANYRAKQSAGELGVGNTASANYQAYGGFNTTDQPMLEMTVTGGTVNLGILSPGTTATATTTFSVRTYLASGYVVAVVGTPPTNIVNGTDVIDPIPSAATSTPGTEQFGLNLVANTSPTTFGAAPSQLPDSTFSFGTVAAGYNTANNFKYVAGDTVASSTKSSGQTLFTASYILNIAPLTPNGDYTADQTFVATSTF